MNAVRILLASALLFAFVGIASAADIGFCNIELKHFPSEVPISNDGSMSSPVELYETWVLRFEAYNTEPAGGAWITDATIQLYTVEYEEYGPWAVSHYIEHQDFGPGGSCGVKSKKYEYFLSTEDAYIGPQAGEKKRLGVKVFSGQSSNHGDFDKYFDYKPDPALYRPPCGRGLISANNCWCEYKDNDADSDYKDAGERACDIVAPYAGGSPIESGCTPTGSNYCCGSTYSLSPCLCSTGTYDVNYPNYNCKSIMDINYTSNSKTVGANNFEFQIRAKRNLPALGHDGVTPLDLKMTSWRISNAFVSQHNYYRNKNCPGADCLDAEQYKWFPWNIDSATHTAEYMNSLYKLSGCCSGYQENFSSEIPLTAGNQVIIDNNPPASIDNHFTIRDSGGLYKFIMYIYYKYTDPYDGTEKTTSDYVYTATANAGDPSWENCGHAGSWRNYYCYPEPKFGYTDVILYDINPSFYYIAPDTLYYTKLHVYNWGQADWPANPGNVKGLVGGNETVWARQRIYSSDGIMLFPHKELGEEDDEPEEQWVPLNYLQFADQSTCDGGWYGWCTDPDAEALKDISFSISKEDYSEFLKYASQMLVDVGTWKTTPPTGNPPDTNMFYKLDARSSKVSVSRLAMLKDDDPLLSCINPSNINQVCHCSPTAADSCDLASWAQDAECCYFNTLTDYLFYGESKQYPLLLRNPLDTESKYSLSYSADPFGSPIGKFKENSSAIGKTAYGDPFTTYAENYFEVSVPEETTLPSAEYVVSSASTDFPTVGDDTILTIFFVSTNLKIISFFMCEQGVGGCVETGKSFYSSADLVSKPTWWHLDVNNEGTSAEDISGTVVAKNKNGTVCTWSFSQPGVAGGAMQPFEGSFGACGVALFDDGTYTLEANVNALASEPVTLDNHETIFFAVGGREIIVPDASLLTALVVALIVFYLVVRK